jgi:hypothetical protein
MTGNIWIDLRLSLAEIEVEISDMSDELSRIPTVVVQWANVGFRERSTTHSTATACPKITQTAAISQRFRTL